MTPAGCAAGGMLQWARRTAGKRLVALVAVAVCMACAAPAMAATLVNRDRVAYKWAVYWDDLSGIDHGEIKAGEEKALPKDAQCLLELQGRRDSIYVKPGDTILIINGVMRKKEP